MDMRAWDLEKNGARLGVFSPPGKRASSPWWVWTLGNTNLFSLERPHNSATIHNCSIEISQKGVGEWRVIWTLQRLDVAKFETSLGIPSKDQGRGNFLTDIFWNQSCSPFVLGSTSWAYLLFDEFKDDVLGYFYEVLISDGANPAFKLFNILRFRTQQNALS